MNNSWNERLQGLMIKMGQMELDQVLITSPTNIYYLTGFQCNPHERFLCLAVDGKKGACTLYVPALDLHDAQAAGQSGKFSGSIVPVSDVDNPYAILAKNMGNSLRIGVEKNVLTLASSEKLFEALGAPQFVDAAPLLLAMRMKKSTEEIAKVRYSISLVEQVIDYAVKSAVIGMSETELTAELEYQMRKIGADRPAFESIVLAGSRTALPHGKPSAYAMQKGDLVLIDIGVQVNGYCSDITRTFVMGEATKEQEDIYDAVLAANMAAIQASRAGVPLSAIDKAARDVITERGYGSLFTHRVGHGFGLDIHEAPSVSGDNVMQIEAGLLYTIEPGVYDQVIGGVRIEDDVYINEAGEAEVLTTYPKALRVIG